MATRSDVERRAFLVGGGLASFAAAAYLMRDGGLRGENITIFEARPRPGGSLGVFGDAQTGYVYPGGRVFEKYYRCALELFSMAPSCSDPEKSIADEIRFFNEHHDWYNRARLVDRNGAIVDTRRLGLNAGNHFDIIRLLMSRESSLNGKAIHQCMRPSFFETNFWYIWSSIMAFRPSHSAIEMRRYLLRFFHILPDLATMTFIMRTKYNQYQAIVEPLRQGRASS